MELKSELRAALNEDLERVAQELQDESNCPGKEFYRKAERLKMYHGTGGWAMRLGHIKDVETHMRKAREHFAMIANIQREVDMRVVEASPGLPRGKLVRWSPPSKEEVVAAVKGLKNNKSQDQIGVQPELIKAACEHPEVSTLFHKFIGRMWNGQEEPPEYWNQAILVPLYKGKGKFEELDNWRGISIQAWSRKVLMRCILNRLNQVVALCVHGSQAGFRPSRSCADVTFTLRRLMEDFRELQQRMKDTGRDVEEDLYMLFVDFSKAFDSVPREALWYLLEHKYYVEPGIVDLLRKLYKDTSATISYKGQMDSKAFDILVGVLQGDVASPVFWIIYLNSVLANLEEEARQ